MEKKQTAVEWLEQKIQEQRESGETDLRTTLYYCRQAKEMEKEQMLELQLHKDFTVGLWATDRPDLIQDLNNVLFQINFSTI